MSLPSWLSPVAAKLTTPKKSRKRHSENRQAANKGRSPLLVESLETRVVPAVALTSATGGGAISADSLGGASTVLTNPKLVESAGGLIGIGTIDLHAPAGFAFDVAVPVTVTVTGTGAGSNINNDASGTIESLTSQTSTDLIFTINSSSQGNKDTLLWQQIHVLPTSGTAGTTGSITNVGTSSFTLGTNTNYGTLTEVAGVAAQLAFVQGPSNGSVNSNIAPAVTVQVEDQFSNPVKSTAAVQLTLNNAAGASLSGTNPKNAANASGIATFSNLRINEVGTGYTLTATSSGLTASPISSSFSITGNATTIAVNSSASSIAFGAPLTLSATVTNLQTVSTGSPTGAVEFWDGPVGTGADLGSGTRAGGTNAATFTLPTINTLSIGTHTIYAVYTSTGNYSSGTSLGFPVVVIPDSSSTTVSAAGGVYNGSAFPVSAEATGDGGLDDTNSGDFTFDYRITDTNIDLAAAPVFVGNYTVAATYNGDATHSGSTSIPAAFSITKASSSTTASDAGGIYTGFAFPANAEATGPVGLDNTSSAFFTFDYTNTDTSADLGAVAPVHVGNYSVTATYNGDLNHSGSTSIPVAFSITQASSSTTVSDAGGIYTGSAYTASAEVMGAGGLDDTDAGDFTFDYVNLDSSTDLGATAPSNVGNYSVTATYNGDSNHSGSTSSTVDFSITKAGSTTTVSDAGGIFTGSAFPASATVTGPGLNDTNAGDFTFDYTNIDTSTDLGANAPIAVGHYSVTATFNGDPNHNGSASNTVDFTINKVPSVTLTLASGGNAISADHSVDFVSVSLNNPKLNEAAAGDIGTGTIDLVAPAGFQFDTGAVVTVKVAGSGNASKNINSTANGGTISLTSESATDLILTISSVSTVANTLTWQNIHVLPISGSLISGNITENGSSLFSVLGGGANWGTLTEMAGVGAQLVFVGEPSSTNVNSNISPNVTVQVEDQFGNPAKSTATVTLALAGGPAGATLSGTNPKNATNGTGIATFGNLKVNEVGTGYALTATSPGLTASPVSSSFSINGNATGVEVNSSASSILFGAPLMLSAVVTNLQTVSAGSPTGAVEFWDGAVGLGTDLGSGTRVAGTNAATFTLPTINTLSVGTHTIYAVYTSTGIYSSGTSLGFTEVVNQASSSTTVIDAGGIYTGSAFPASAEATGVGGLDDANAGDFTFDYTNTDTTADLGANAPINVGNYAVTATYNGDVNHTGSTSVPVDFSITLASTTTTVTDAGGVYAGSAFPASAEAIGAGGLDDINAGDFTFDYTNTDTNTDLGATAPIDVGNYSVRATYNGDLNHSGSTSAPVAFGITEATPTVSAGDAGGVY